MLKPRTSASLLLIAETKQPEPGNSTEKRKTKCAKQKVHKNLRKREFNKSGPVCNNECNTVNSTLQENLIPNKVKDRNLTLLPTTQNPKSVLSCQPRITKNQNAKQQSTTQQIETPGLNHHNSESVKTETTRSSIQNMPDPGQKLKFLKPLETHQKLKAKREKRMTLLMPKEDHGTVIFITKEKENYEKEFVPPMYEMIVVNKLSVRYGNSVII
ncbi:hypothetical protein ABEB36_014655 [Hypothenemus hampei]|uniref:Uncharacterized protein n=1 Tax=Hypothenemus hampei TaxID=57062 RepID=A0ABD1E3D7_HYPHA